MSENLEGGYVELTEPVNGANQALEDIKEGIDNPIL